ncbi:hypothetical protein PFISCL1PPCAC_16467, partial [Pristionchus fissidentatus]
QRKAQQREVQDAQQDFGEGANSTDPFAHMRQREVQAAQKDAQALINAGNGQFRVSSAETINFTSADLRQESIILGRGGFGSVYKGKFLPRDIDIAIKKIDIIQRSGGQNDGRGRSDVIREVVNGKPSHANIVKLYGFVVQGFTCRICMEVMHANLDEVKRVAHNDRIPGLSQKFKKKEIESFLGCVTVAVVDALVFLRNDARVMQRDIKPSNIMINSNGSVKICDFGVSKKLVTGLTSKNATESVGTLSYLAPERFDKEYGSKSEVWSLGITLAEFANGRHPYSAHLSAAPTDFAVSEVIRDPKIAPEAVEGDFSADLRNFVEFWRVIDIPDRIFTIWEGFLNEMDWQMCVSHGQSVAITNPRLSQ